MSGSSYNYLCYAAPEDLLRNTYQLGRMARDLQHDFPNSKAAQHTNDLLKLIEHLTQEVDRRKNALEEVWHNQEWSKSGDMVKLDVEKAVNKYEEGCS